MQLKQTATTLVQISDSYENAAEIDFLEREFIKAFMNTLLQNGWLTQMSDGRFVIEDWRDDRGRYNYADRRYKE